jgi:hypothetical protein
MQIKPQIKHNFTHKNAKTLFRPLTANDFRLKTKTSTLLGPQASDWNCTISSDGSQAVSLGLELHCQLSWVYRS